MASALLNQGVPPAEEPSPTPSDSSLSTVPDQTHHPSRRRPRRKSSRLPLRSAFRTFDNFATILVGEPDSKTRPETKYTIHKNLLTSASPFFAAALNGTFAEGADQTVKLPEEKPEIFEWFLQWIYTGTLKTPVTDSCTILGPNGIALDSAFAMLPSQRARLHMNEDYHAFQRGRAQMLDNYEKRSDGDLRNGQGYPKYFLLLDLYALSDRMLTTQLSNHILSTIARLSESTNSVPTPSDTWILYDSASIRESSPLKTLVLDLFHYKKTDKLLETHRDEWHPRFMRELLVKMKRPGPEAIERHTLVAWRPLSWETSKACEACRHVLEPGVSGDKCCVCEKVFCTSCLRSAGGALGNGTGGGLTDTTGCKPWSGRGMCLRYHEHSDGEGCN
jgi:heterogeneous nuclear rnp K-like protein